MIFSFALLFKAMWTGLAGAFGAGSRHTVSQISRQRFGNFFPAGTLFINVTGALLIGIVSTLFIRFHQYASWHAPVILGFIGGYTTFSTFMLEISALRTAGSRRRITLYIMLSAVLGPLFAYAGLLLGRVI